MSEATESNLLDAPCVFCGYNGKDYWQTGSHKPWCPWMNVAGIDRTRRLRSIVHRMAQLWMAGTALFVFQRDVASRDLTQEASDE